MDDKRLVKELSSPIAEGRTAEILAWGDEHILKLYRDWFPSDAVEYESCIAHAVYEAGIPSPEPGEIIEVDGRRGLIYERLAGLSMLQDMNARPWMLLKHARSLAELHVQIHQQAIPGVPSYKDRLRYDITHTPHLDKTLQKKALARLETLPDGEGLCHGDYHPGNVLITKTGPLVIDWMTASTGSPWADVARTNLLLTIGPKGARNQVGRITLMAIGLFYRTYIHRYESLYPDKEKEMNSWLPVIAAARLSENITPERETLLEIVKLEI